MICWRTRPRHKPEGTNERTNGLRFTGAYFLHFLLQDYTEVVAEPMDFSSVCRRLEDNLYNDPETFVRDVRLIFSNSRAYNTVPRSRV